MDKRKAELVEHEKALQQLNRHMESLYLDLGKYVFDNHAKQLKDDPYTGILKTIRSHVTSSKKISGEIKSLQETEDSLDSLKKEILEFESQRKEQEKAIPGLYEDIGSLAYSLYKNNTASFDQYESYFFELKSYDDELVDIEDTIQKTDEDEKAKPFFEKIAGRGQKALLLGKKLLKARSLPGYYQSLGKSLHDAGYFDNAPLPDLAEPYDALLKSRKEADRLEAASKDRRKEAEELEAALQEQIEGKKTGKRISELKRSIDAEEQTVTDRYRELGVACFEKRPTAIRDIGEFQHLYREIQSNVVQIDSHSEEITRLSEEIEYTRLTERIEVIKRSIASCLSGIEKYQIKIDNMNQEIALLEEERSKLKKG